MTYSQPDQPPAGRSPQGRPQGTGASLDLKRLRPADYAIAGLTLLFLILTFFTWYDFGDGFFGVDVSVSGWTDGQVKLAFFLFLLASAWAMLPAVTDLRLGFPRSLVTVGLAALGFLLTLFAWFDTFDFDFSLWALLGTVTAAAILAFAVLSLLPELRNRPALPGRLAGAAEWANRPASGAGQPAQPHGQPVPQPPPPAQPPTYGSSAAPGQPGGPQPPGGPV